MRVTSGLGRAAAGLVLVCAAGGAMAQRGNVLDTVQPGEWRLSSDSGEQRRMCVAGRNRSTMLQIRHAGVQCQQFVVDSGERSTTVRYTCPGHGHGRTHIIVETPRLMQIETQGVADGAPFAERYEARRVGNCG